MIIYIIVPNKSVLQLGFYIYIILQRGVFEGVIKITMGRSRLGIEAYFYGFINLSIKNEKKMSNYLDSIR